MSDTADIHRDWANWLTRLSGMAITKVATEAGLAHTTLARKDDDDFRGYTARTIEKVCAKFNVPGPTEWSLGYGIDDVTVCEPPPEDIGIKPEGKEQSIWIVNTRACGLLGYMPGDYVLIDSRIEPTRGDVVIARIYDITDRREKYVLRAHKGPYLVPKSADNRDDDVYSIDPGSTVILGVALEATRRRQQIS